MKKQIIIEPSRDYHEIGEYIDNNNINNILLVCDEGSLPFLKIYNYFDHLASEGKNIIRFSDFEPNPLYESVVKGIKAFKENNCDTIIAVGGGSAMDVAKCIKAYANMDDSKLYIDQEIKPNDINLIAIPTTAGTGSEATRYAVIYYQGEKQSITSESFIPSVVFMDSSCLDTLPIYQRKSTMLDALCHSVESFWSVNSTDESKQYSLEALKIILENKDGYLNNEPDANKKMLRAAYIAGKAINITQTTAGHAMCYKMTSIYKIAHGHAAALCMVKIWRYMNDNIDKCIDIRGKEYLKEIFIHLANIIGTNEVESAIQNLENMLNDIGIKKPNKVNANDFEVLTNSVNTTRLKNNPVELNKEDINKIYHMILD